MFATVNYCPLSPLGCPVCISLTALDIGLAQGVEHFTMLASHGLIGIVNNIDLYSGASIL